MIRVPWDLEEAVALLNLYERYGETSVPPLHEIENLSKIYQHRAHVLGLNIDDKFRNVAGLNLQLACFHYIATNGQHGMSSASRLFYQTYDLYINSPDTFQRICNEFYRKYDF